MVGFYKSFKSGLVTQTSCADACQNLTTTSRFLTLTVRFRQIANTFASLLYLITFRGAADSSISYDAEKKNRNENVSRLCRKKVRYKHMKNYSDYRVSLATFQIG